MFTTIKNHFKIDEDELPANRALLLQQKEIFVLYTLLAETIHFTRIFTISYKENKLDFEFKQID